MLRRLVTTPDGVRALIRGTATDPLVARLADEGLFEDGPSRPGTVRDLVADRPIPIPLTATAAPAPGRSRFWRLDDETELRALERLADALGAAAQRTMDDDVTKP